MPAFPKEHLEPLLDNTWRDTAKGIINNWLGLVYEHTDFNARGRRARPSEASRKP